MSKSSKWKTDTTIVFKEKAMPFYQFTTTLYPYGKSATRGMVGIDKPLNYGYWEHIDGSEGGGLWFDRLTDGRLNLIDYDGDYMLPKPVIDALRLAGFCVDVDFE
jgi:hypothetical protein